MFNVEGDGSGADILLEDAAILFAKGGETTGEDGMSCGISARGSIIASGQSRIDASSALEAGRCAGIFFDGPSVLTLSDSAEVIALSYQAQAQSGAILAHGGELTVADGCYLYARSGAAPEGSVAISGFETLVPGGVILAHAGQSDVLSVGILMHEEPGDPIALERGQILASGQTAAICGLAEDDIYFENLSSFTVSAPYLEYCTVYDGLELIPVTPENGTATLNADREHKLVMALADGTLYDVRITDIHTELYSGGVADFAAKAAPRSVVKVEEERWCPPVRRCPSRTRSRCTLTTFRTATGSPPRWTS